MSCKINGEECDNKKKYELTTGFSILWSDIIQAGSHHNAKYSIGLL